jgi:hypothetical protein
MAIRRFAFSQAVVRSTGQRLRVSGSRVRSSRRRPRATSRVGSPAGIGSPGRRRLLIRGSIRRWRSACASAAPS